MKVIIEKDDFDNIISVVYQRGRVMPNNKFISEAEIQRVKDDLYDIYSDKIKSSGD